MAERICPWWKGFFLINPFRKIYENPDKILAPYLKEGMQVLEVGPGMGFFTIPIARYIGNTGKIVCVDIQEKMLKSLRKRAERARIAERLDIRLASSTSLNIKDLNETIDFILAYAVVHEIESPDIIFKELFNALKKNGLLLISEPKNHVTMESFNTSIMIAEKAGFKIINNLEIPKNHSILMTK